MEEIAIKSSKHFEFIDITREIQNVVRKNRVSEGICHLYVPHTTAAITINENADPAVKNDIISTFAKLIPWNGFYTHLEGNSAAHILSTIVGVSAVIPISRGELTLGRWQGIYFCEFDGPRIRRLIVSIMGE